MSSHSPSSEDTPSPGDLDALLARVRSGDEASRDLLIERYYPTVQRLVHRRLASDLRLHRPWLNARFSTGDIVQEVFKSALASLEGFQGGSEEALIGYLSMVVRNRIVDAIRFHEADQRDIRLGASPENLEREPSDGEDPGEIALRQDDLRKFREVLAELPERERLLVRARLEDGESFGTLARKLGYPSYFAARRAFFDAQARVLIRLRGGA